MTRSWTPYNWPTWNTKQALQQRQQRIDRSYLIVGGLGLLLLLFILLGGTWHV
ncbi:MAG: hypothetical protein R3E89_18380 [Thiolinea sp.]